MDPRNVDVQRLEAQVRGFMVINTYPCTEALRALANIFLFDPSNYDRAVHFIPRGDDSAATITEADMLDDETDIEETRKPDAIAIPRVLHLNYFDIAGGGLSTDKQSSERSGDRRATGETSLQSPVLMNSEEAARAVAVNHKIMIEDQRGELKFCLPDSFLQLIPANNTIVQWQGRSERARIIKITTQDGYQEYVLMRDRQSAYTANVEPIPAATPSVPPSGITGPTIIVPLDIHILRDADDNEGLAYYVAVSGALAAWQGALVELSYDSGANYVDGASTDVAAVIGELTQVLPDHPQAFPDEVHTVQVRIHTPFAELESTDLTGLLNRANLAIMGEEIVQFAGADALDDEGLWELSYFLRGRKGTATAAHAIGTPFVLLERSALTLIPASLTDLGRTLTFRATSVGTSPADGTVVSMLFAGRTQIEREPGYVMARRDGTDAIVSWQGVARLGSGANVAHGARFDGYRVTFEDGDTSNTVVVNTDAQTVTQDVSGLGSPLSISVQQLNALTGAGPATEVIII
jgi:hypothetical protein